MLTSWRGRCRRIQRPGLEQREWTIGFDSVSQSRVVLTWRELRFVDAVERVAWMAESGSSSSSHSSSAPKRKAARPLQPLHADDGIG